MLVNSSVARLQNYTHEMMAQIQESVRAFQRVVGVSCRPQFISLIEATRQRVDILLSLCEPGWRALRQRTGEALSHQSHLRLLATRARDGAHAILVQSEPPLNRIRSLYDTTKNRKTLLTLIVAAFAGLALIMLLLKMGMNNQASNEHVGSVKVTTSSLTQVPDWTIFDDAFANQPTRLATSEFVEGVRAFGAALTTDTAETTGHVMREPIPLPRPRPKRR
jgi:hypothetical protein